MVSNRHIVDTLVGQARSSSVRHKKRHDNRAVKRDYKPYVSDKKRYLRKQPVKVSDRGRKNHAGTHEKT
ncbi:MAG: hypothetical protein PHT79_09760 [Syntrophomonadaceae bacterium]|nr:hypothetical protein [Syntrophomonadaceae bacterium]MDD4550027.1 hypothetical protein [Syntrophomonadaceae bacterium]